MTVETIGRDMPIPESVQRILQEFGQAATEVPCSVEGCREFVSIYKSASTLISGFNKRFPYYHNANIVYRVCRFRVLSEMIEMDVNVGPNDLLDLQDIYVPDEEVVQAILAMWLDDIGVLKKPSDCAIPV